MPPSAVRNPHPRLTWAVVLAALTLPIVAAPANAAPAVDPNRQAAASALRKFHKTVQNGFPAKAEELAAFEAAVQKLADGSARWYFENELRRYQALFAIKAGDAAGAAQLLAGTIAMEAETGPEGKWVVKAEANHCYVVFFATKKLYQPGEVRVLVEGNAPTVQVFDVWQPRGWREADASGFCALKSENVAMSIVMPKETPAGKATLTVLRWTRDQLPIALMGVSALRSDDQCDNARWAMLWKAPVPGTLLYAGSTPYLIAGPGMPHNSEKPDGLGTAHNDVAINPEILSGSLEGDLTVSSLTEFPGCPHKFTMTPRSAPHTKAIKACHDKIDAKYQPQWKSIGRLREAARKQGGISPKAEKMASALEDKQRKDRAKTCIPLEQKAEAAFRATLEDIAKSLTASPPKDTLDRATYLREMHQ